jgi:hypothetical protein
MARVLRCKAEIVKNRQQRKAARLQKRIDKENRSRSIEIYRRYLLHFNNGSKNNPVKARRETAQEYRIPIVDAKYFISQGKQFIKKAA